jgi:hypothetical protein
VTLVLPWRFILLWGGRFVVWAFFGPHMKLVDLLLMPGEGKEKVLIKTSDRLFQQARLRREEAVKVQDIKVLAFGEYSVQVPSFNVARHFDKPLAHSFANPCHDRPNLHIARMIPGQQVYGTMIPRPEKEALLYAQNEQRILEERKISSTPDIRDTLSSDTVKTVTESNTDNEKEVARAPARDSKGVNGSANGCVATADEGMEVLPKNVGFIEDEGMEVVATGRLQSTFTELEEIELLRCKSLDSVLFHKQEAQQNQHDDDDEEELDGISDGNGKEYR